MIPNFIPPVPAKHKICATCRRPLNVFVPLDEDGSFIEGALPEYYHPSSFTDCDEVVPIDPDGGPVRYVCDFCLAADPTWDFAAEPFESTFEGDPKRYIESEEWTACDGCRTLVEAQDWRGLWARNQHLQGLRTENPSQFHQARLVVLNMWLEFDRLRKGPSRPVER